VDVLRDHRKNDLRHDLDGHRVRCNANRHDHRVMDGHCDHHLHVGDRHHKDFRDVDDWNLDVSRGLRTSDQLVGHHDQKLDGNLGVNLCRRMNDRLDDQMTDVMTDGSHDHRMSDLLDDHSMDDDHHGALVGHRKNGMDDRKTDENSDVSRGLHMSDRLDDRRTDDDHHDVLVGRRKNVTDDRNDLKTDGNHVNRGSGVHPNAQSVCEHRVDLKIDPECYAPRDLMMDANLGAKNLHVMLMDDLSMSCDRMSHDHLQYDHQMMRHRDTNRMDGKMKIHHVNHPKMDVRMHLNHVIHLMMVCLMKI